MRTHRSLSIAALALAAPLLAGCPTGPSAGSYAVAHSPRGVATELRVGGENIAGELLELRDTAFVVLAPTRARAAAGTGATTPAGREVVLVPFRVVRRGRFAQVDEPYVGGRPGAKTFALLQHLSRFPRGLSAENMARLLASLGQREPRVAGT
jgi:hypothetical protein